MRRWWMSMAANIVEEMSSSFSSINIKRGEEAAATAALAQGSTMPLPRPPGASASSGRRRRSPGPPSETRRGEGHGGRGRSRFSRSKAGKGERATTTSHDGSSAGVKGSSGDDGGDDDEQQGGKKPARRTKKRYSAFGRDVEGLEGYRRFEVHVPDCACREAFWLSSITADKRGYIAAETEGPPGSRSAKVWLVLPSKDHSLEGEKEVLRLLLAKGINRTHIEAAKCARLTIAESPGQRREPSFLHGAVYILGEAPHLASLADIYGFRAGLGGEKGDVACCLLVAPLPAELRGVTQEIMAREVRKSLLEQWTSKPMVCPKDQKCRFGHHLSTILEGLSGPLIISSLAPHRVSLRKPALLAMAQEWPEKYTIDEFGGKRELGESSLEAAIRETKEESGQTLALEDTRYFTRIPGLDLKDDSMAFFAFLYRAEQVKARRHWSILVEEQAVEGSSGIRKVKSNQYLRELKTEQEVLVEARRPRSMSVEGRGEQAVDDCVADEEASSDIRRMMKSDQYLLEVERERKVVVVGGGGAGEAGGKRGGGNEQQQQQQQQRREEGEVLAVGGGEKRESRGEQQHDEEEVSIGVGGGGGGRGKLRAEAAPFQPASSSTSSRDREKGWGRTVGSRERVPSR